MSLDPAELRGSTVADVLASEEYLRCKREALRHLRHAIAQVKKDQHVNAQFAATEASLEMQRAFGLIRMVPL